MNEHSRRTFLASVASGVPGLAVSGRDGAPDAAAALQVVVVGAHPDDPESGCGGTIARYVAAGHHVTIVYLTRGERGIGGKGLDEAARIRTAEAEQACRILGATPVFAGQIDGATEAHAAAARAMTTLLEAARPDVIFTHWPIDTHFDHQVASVLTWRAWLALHRTPALFYFEVNAGEQTRVFAPTDYVDVTTVRDAKTRALFAHASQDGVGVYREHHEPMERFRGREIGVAAAEAFIRVQRPALPG